MASPTEGTAHEQLQAKSKKVRDHRDLRVWRKSRKLRDLCELEAARFPAAQSNLAGFLRRVANEVPEEIAAGQQQGLHAAYMDHLQRARAAVRHLERGLIEAHKAGCMESPIGDGLLARSAEIERMLAKLMVSLELSYARRRVSASLK